MIILIVFLSAREWVLLLARRKLSRLSESAPVWLPAYALAESESHSEFGCSRCCCCWPKNCPGKRPCAGRRQAEGLLCRARRYR